MMAHSNKPQPEVNDGENLYENPYGSYEDQCRDYAEQYFANPDFAAQVELEAEFSARYDQYDGYDTGDLNYDGARENEEADAKADAEAAAPVVAPLPPPSPVDEDDILF